MSNGFLISSACSGSGKTLVTLGLLRAFCDNGYDVSPAKAGPDFIDPMFHRSACGKDCINLDPWAMSPQRLQHLAGTHGSNSLLVVEGMMGLYDGALDGTGTPADLAKLLDLPIIFVIDCTGQSHSVSALVRGFITHDPSLSFGGIILNNVGSPRHESILRRALESCDIEILGVIPRKEDLQVPSRHLGLVPAAELSDLESFITRASSTIQESLDLSRLSTFSCAPFASSSSSSLFPPLGQKIAIASDIAFSFTYPHLLTDWHTQGCELNFFSPLADESPPSDCDAIYLPGGYPELHCDRLSSCSAFFDSLRSASEQGIFIYGECGGYMVLGESIIDSSGVSHPMSNLLPLTTSFSSRKLSLGYRRATLSTSCPLGEQGMSFGSHEFHYSTLVSGSDSSVSPLFSLTDSLGTDLGFSGMRVGNTMGSYIHLLDTYE